jgi:hypothetical protein
VKLGRDESFVELSDNTGSSSGELWSVAVRLVVPGLSAETVVHLADPSLESDLPTWFAALAAEWRGSLLHAATTGPVTCRFEFGSPKRTAAHGALRRRSCSKQGS